MFKKVWAWLLLPILMMLGASTSQAMEVDDEDIIKVWQDPSTHQETPDNFIPCPLSKEQLAEHYSLTFTGATTPFYTKQEAAMRKFYLDPPLSKPITSSPHSRQGKTSMTPMAVSSIETRAKTLDEFAGFSAKWLHLEPTMELASNPQVVAKYVGFHVAKGTNESTINKITTHLHQVCLTFLPSTSCPKLTHQDPTQLSKVNDWYTNLCGKMLASISKHYQARDEGITLWKVWEATSHKWDAFQAKFKVGGSLLDCQLVLALLEYGACLPWLLGSPTCGPTLECRRQRASGPPHFGGSASSVCLPSL